MKKGILALLFTPLLLTACVDKEILDDVNLETASAYDYIGKNTIRGTALVPVYMPNKVVKNKTYSATSTLSRDFLRDIERQSSDPIVTGSLKVALFGERLSEKGIVKLIDSFQRDASVGATILLAVSDGNAEDTLEGDYGSRGTANYIANLIRQNIKTKDLPKSNLQLFLADYYQKGRTPYLPQLKKLNNEQLEINGISLFKGDRVIDTLPANQMFYFKLLVDRYSKGSLKVELGKNMASIQSIQSKYKKEITSRKPLNIKVNLKVKAVLNEYSGKHVTPKEVHIIEKKVKKDIEHQCTKLIRRFQNEEIDPVGFGFFVKSKTRGFDFKKWDREYSQLKVKVNADVSIMESGVIE